MIGENWQYYLKFSIINIIKIIVLKTKRFKELKKERDLSFFEVILGFN